MTENMQRMKTSLPLGFNAGTRCGCSGNHLCLERKYRVDRRQFGAVWRISSGQQK